MHLMVSAGQKFRIETASVWLDCGQPDAVLETNRYLLENGRDNSAEYKDHPTVIIVPPVNIAPSAQISDSVIGPHVTIAANCEISGAIIQNSILDEGAICKNFLMGQSLVGRNARVEGHFRSVNVGDSSAIGIVE